MSDNDTPTPANAGLLGGAAVFVVAMAAIFGVIGLLRDDTPGLEVLDGDGVAASPEPEPTATTPTAPTVTATATPTDTGTPSATATPTDGPTGPAIDKAEISVQVLDGTGDGADAFQTVVDNLTTAGYDVQATFVSRRVYDSTTVFFTPGGEGNEAAANQIAAEFGFDVVLATPDDVNLSDSVRVHIVVGTDA